jgi:hypothetical protein
MTKRKKKNGKSRDSTRFLKYTEKKGTEVVGYRKTGKYKEKKWAAEKVVGHKEKVAYTEEGWYMKKVPITKKVYTTYYVPEEEKVYKTKRKLESPAIKAALSRKVKAPKLKKYKKYLLDEKRRIKVRIGGR